MSFDVLAPHYRWMEFVLAGEKLQRCRTAFLDEAATARNVLIAGEGHGRFLVECCGRLPSARITCVDSSARMLAVARARMERAGFEADRATFIHADLLTWSAPEGGTDLVVTQFVLDCFAPDQLERVIAGLARAARPKATWLLADFQMPQRGLPRIRSRLILRVMYAFFRAVTRLPARRLTPPDDCLQRHGFRLGDRRESEWGLLRTDRWER